MPDQHALRKAAILVASLDHRAADEMLDRMPSHQAEAIRRMILSLPAIDEAEEANVIRDFLVERAPNSAERTEIDENPDDVTLSLSNPDGEGDAPRGPSTFASLPEEELATFLYHERAPTIAGVLSRLPSERAAAIIGRLAAEKRPHVLRALARGVAASDAVIEEIRAEIAAQSDKRTEAPSAGQTVDHAKSILEGIGGVARDELLEELAIADEVLARRLGWSESGSPTTARSGSTQAQDAASDEFPDTSWDRNRRHEMPATNSDSASHLLTFEDLLRLDDATLAAALGTVEPQVAVLALTGPGEGVLNRLAKHLPPQQTQQIRHRIRKQEPFALADIHIAQQRVVSAARNLCAGFKSATQR